MLFKTTKRLFKGIYQYKIVLVVPGASLFRSGDMDATLERLNKIVDFTSEKSKYNGIRTPEDLEYALKLQKQLKKLKDIEVRVETPLITVYSNSEPNLMSLAKIDTSKVKYLSRPLENISLEVNTIVMPKMDYDYRITLGKTSQEHSAFVQWAGTNQKIKLTKSCIRDLQRNRSWGGTHFYVTGDNNMLMVKMHLGGSINKVERIIKA